MNYKRHRRRRHRLHARSRSPPTGPTLTISADASRLDRQARALVKQVKDIMDPRRQDGRRQPARLRVYGPCRRPVRAGRFRLRKARRCRDRPRHGTATKCIQCNQLRLCLPARHHPSLRTDRGRGDRPPPPLRRSFRSRPARARACTQYTMAISPLDCMGCGVCVGVCPAKALTMVPQESQLPQQEVFNYVRVQVSAEEGHAGQRPSRAASSSSPCWSSPAPAQAAPRPPMPASSPSSSATGCISPTPPAAPPSGAAPARPLPTAPTRKATAPPGPTPCLRTTPSTAWACTLGQKAIRESLADEDSRCRAMPVRLNEPPKWLEQEAASCAKATASDTTGRAGAANTEAARAEGP